MPDETLQTRPLDVSVSRAAPAVENLLSPADSTWSGQPDQGDSWGPEVEVILACARAHLDDQHAQRIRALLSGDPDWERLFQLAAFHRLTAFVFHHLRASAPDLVPDEMLAFFQTWFIQNATRSLGQVAELLDLLSLLREGGVLAVPYKGPALAARVYGNLALRQSCDLDILVERREVLRAESLLEGAGFHPRYPSSIEGRDFLLRNHHSEILVRPHGPVVELHWAFTNVDVGFPLRLEQLRPRLVVQSLGGAQLPAFATEDLLLILCVHGAKHCWDRLEWLTVVSDLLRKEPVSWPEVISRATELGSEKTLYLGLLLASDLLKAPVPPHVLETARSIHDVIHLVKIVRQRLSAEEVGPTISLPRDLFRMRLQPTSRGRFRYLLHRLSTPGREDTRLMLPLGSHSVPLPSLFRPFLVFGKLCGGLFRRSGRRAPVQQRRP